jgi:hypothetical protein
MLGALATQFRKADCLMPKPRVAGPMSMTTMRLVAETDDGDDEPQLRRA